jgi:parvulin-like peptidyl-prolyl isomerase
VVRVRQPVIIVLLLLVLLASCAEQGAQSLARKDARVATFLNLFPEARQASTSFGGATLDSIRDVVRQECGQIQLPDRLVRVTYVAKAATLAAYVDPANNTLLCVATKLNQDAFTIRKGDPSSVPNGTLLSVNGDPLSQKDLQLAFDQLSPEVQNQTSAAGLLNSLVDQRLLRQASANITIDESQLSAAAERSWNASGFESHAALEAALAQQGATYEQFLGSVREQLELEALAQRQGITDVNISPSEALQFYVNNPNLFLVSEQVRFRQLFIFANESGKQGALERMRRALDEVNRSGFCTAVRDWSDDVTSRERCGEYTAPRGVLLPQLESAIFSLEENSSTVVESPSGYHLIVVLEHQQTSVLPYAQAEQQVIGYLRTSAMQQRLGVYLLKLRADADIVDYT